MPTRPSWARRTRSRRSGWSANAVGGRSPPLVSVSAGMPCASSGPCSCSVNGNAEVDELRERARMRRAPARLLEHALRGGLDESPARRGAARCPASTSRGGPWPRALSRATAATMRPAVASRRTGARRASPKAPPSVATKTSVCCGPDGPRADAVAVRPRELDQGRDARGVVVRARPAAVVVAVRHDDDLVRRAPGDGHDLVDERPLPKPGTSARKRSGSTRQPVGRQLVADPLFAHRRRPRFPARGPGRAAPAPRRARPRSGRRTRRAAAICGGGSGPGLCTLKAATRSGIPTSSQVPR